MISTDLQVKGSTIRSKIAFVRERFGADAARELGDFLASKGHFQVLEGGWYDFDVYNDLLVHLAEEHYGGDLARLVEVGQYSAEVALTTTYDVFAGRGDFVQFLQRISVLHGRFYSRGELSVELSSEPGKCTLSLHGAAPYSEPDIQIARGFYTGAANLMGLKNVQGEFEIFPEKVQFQVTWQA